MADISSRLPVTDFADGATGSAIPAEAILVGGSDGTNLRALSTSSTGVLNVQIPETTTTGTLSNSSSVVTTTLTSVGSVNVDISGTWVGTINVTEVTPSGGRILGVFNLNSSPVASSITANGNYRVVGVPISSTLSVQFSSYTSGTAVVNIYTSVSQYIVQPYSANAANVLVTSYLNDGAGNAITSTNNALNVAATTSNDTVVTGSITAQDTSSTSTTYYNNQVWYSGTPTTGSVFAVSTMGIETGMIQISGTWTGTLQSEVSVDSGVTWIAHSTHQIGSADFISSYTNNYVGSLNLAGKTNFRIRATSAITGTASIRLINSQNPSSTYVANSVKLLDGSSTTSSTMMNIVPASTAVSATNTAMAVGLSPNSPLPAGTNSIGTVLAKVEDGSGNAINSYNSQLDTADIINTALSSGSITVGTTAVPARVGASNLSNRKQLIISPVTYTIYMGSSSAVTTTTGIPIYPGQVVAFSYSANVTPYLISSTSGTVNIFEAS